MSTNNVIVKEIVVYTRLNTSTTYTTTDVSPVAESKLPMTSKFECLYIYTIGTSTDKYVIISIPHNTDTYIHVINTTTNNHVSTQFYPGTLGTLPEIVDYRMSAINFTDAATTIAPIDSESTVILPEYGPTPLIPLTNSVYADSTNLYLVLNTPPLNKITTYDRFGMQLTEKQERLSTITNAPKLVAWAVVQGDKLILYMAHMMYSLVVIMQNVGSVASPTYLGIGTFKLKITENTKPNSRPNNGRNDVNNQADLVALLSSTIDLKIKQLDDKYKMQSRQPQNQPPLDDFNSYMLKSQLVPPVYPITCNCQTCGSCTDNIKNADKTKDTTADKITDKTKNIYDATGNVVNDAVDISKDTVNGAVGLGRETVNGAVGLGRETVNGAVGLGKDTVTGAVGLGKDAVNGAVGLGKDTVNGLMDIGRNIFGGDKRNSKEQPDYSKSNTVQQVEGVDHFSAYGAMVPKTSNFKPMPASFSAFGK